jgi:hypothetical protein
VGRPVVECCRGPVVGVMNQRKRYRPHPRRFESLQSEMACKRTCTRGGGGHWSGISGDGEAWREGGRVWFWKRPIKAGQWAGPWQRVLVADL